MLGRCMGSCVGSRERLGCRRRAVGVCEEEGAAYGVEEGWGKDGASGEEVHIAFFSGSRFLGKGAQFVEVDSYIRWFRG
jgi:hypothetical protein